MANVIHRTTLEFRRSVDEGEHPEPTWKHNPDMSAIQGVPFRYWKAPANWNAPNAGPRVQTAGEQAATDAALLEANRDSEASAWDNAESLVRALTLVLIDELNTLRAQHSLAARTPAQARAAIRNKLGM